eukprot:PITA_09353
MISEDLMLNNKEILARILPFGGSNHWPIHLEVQSIGTPRNRPFRFENIWLSHPDFSSNIAKWWAEDLNIQGTNMLLLQKRLKHIKLKLKEWNKNEHGNIFVAKKAVEGKMQELNKALITDGFDETRNDHVTKYHQEWEELCKQEEIFWTQKSRVQWLKEGERNTSFFHRSTMANRVHNRISVIKDEKGILHKSHAEIEKDLVKHFQGIAKETGYNIENSIRNFTRHIPRLVSSEDNFNFNKPVTEEEVSEVLKEIQNGKAPGPDGFNADFFKACWSIVKKDILNVEASQTPDKFRPIALCNVVYKIISKVVANRLKPLLPSLVSVEQAGYVEGRQILNNIIQAHKVVHSLTINQKVRWILALVTSSSFSILVNGSPSETFLPSRGLTQGDPLSPFLFILIMEGLGRYINHAKEVDKIKGLQLSYRGQAWTNQQLVDDTMLQGIPTVKEAHAFKQILNEFAKASGMEVNLTKSKIFFFNTNIVIQKNITKILGFQRDSLPSKYLGIPLTTKPLHKSIWELIINKMQDKIRKQMVRSLDLAGRLVLIKVVLHSIPVFMLSILPTPEGVLQLIKNIQRNFLWGKGKVKEKWALVAWEKFCKPRNYGGLGLDDPEILSKALGAKLWWRWLKEPKAQ